jgi:cyclic pyranopterin phosphate synthase
MPAEGLAWLDRGDLLGVDEITRIARICVETFGFDAIRLTGGEPTVRADLVEIVTRLAPLGTDLALTTNGTRLDRLAGPLAAAGLRRVNVSLDSLRPERFEALTRRDDLHRVLVGIRAAVAAGLRPVKVNVVVVRGSNDDELVELARFGRDEGATVRFIEFMPLDDEIVERIGEVFPLERIGRSHEPAERFRYLDGGGEIGVISSVTDAFCSSCDRIRLTADGQVRACLFSTAETDLRALLRGGADDRAVADAIAATVDGKWAGHGITEVSFRRPERSMSQIGG